MRKAETGEYVPIMSDKETLKNQLRQDVYEAAKCGEDVKLLQILSGVKNKKTVLDLLNHKTTEYRQRTTPLIIATLYGLRNVVQAILSNYDVNLEETGDVMVDWSYYRGVTALWCAALCDRLGILKLLIKHGANVRFSIPTRNIVGIDQGRIDDEDYDSSLHRRMPVEVLEEDNREMTPLLAGAAYSCSDIVEFMLSLKQYSREERVQALELLGASKFRNRHSTFGYLRRAMEERHKDQKNVLHKPVCVTVRAYGNHKESRSLEELDAMEHDSQALLMESLAIRERVLGPDNPDVPVIITQYQDLIRDPQRNMELFLRVLELKGRKRRPVTDDISRFLHLFMTQYRYGHVSYDNVKIEAILLLLKFSIEEFEYITSGAGHKQIANERARLMYVILHVILLALNFCQSKTESAELRKMVEHLLDITTKINFPTTPLHMTIRKTLKWAMTERPKYALCTYLIECGNDVDAFDSRSNTPLHAAVEDSTDTSEITDVITLLIEHGCHIDFCNSERKTPLECARGPSRDIILSRYSFTLKCLVAKAIKSYNIQYMNVLPKSLSYFVSRH